MLRICEVNNRWSLDGSRGGNGTHYINHSCVPNAFMQILYDHILFIALRDIEAGEEITIDYESTLHSDDKRCICGAQHLSRHDQSCSESVDSESWQRETELRSASFF